MAKTFFEKDPNFHYIRFAPAEWKYFPKVDTAEGILSMF